MRTNCGLKKFVFGPYLLLFKWLHEAVATVRIGGLMLNILQGARCDAKFFLHAKGGHRPSARQNQCLTPQ